MDSAAAAELQRLGGDPGGFSARQFEDWMAEGAGLVLTATRELRSRVLEAAPRALKRTFTIRELEALTTSSELTQNPSAGPDALVARAAWLRGTVAIEAYDVPDPIGRSVGVHRSVANLLDQACFSIAKIVAAEVNGDETGEQDA